MKRHPHAPPPSRHARDLQLLRHAPTPPRRPVRPDTPVPAPTAAAAATFAGYTVNWQAGPDEPLLVPQRLGPDELPEFPQPCVRALIESTALGQPTTQDLRQQLLAVDIATLEAAIRAGIRRWHTYS